MNFKPNKFKKTVIVFLSFFFFSTSVGLVTFTPQKTQAAYAVVEVGANLANNIITRFESVITNVFLESLYYKEWIADGVVWAVVKELLADIVKEEIIDNIVNSTGGKPAFITDPFMYFRGLEYEAADLALNEILADTNINKIDELFETNIMGILIDKHLGPTDERVKQILTPTLEAEVDGNFDEFKSGNFYEGGWAGFFSLTQNAKNNPIGSYFLTKEAVARVTHDFGQASLNELSWGSGYYGQRNADGNISAPGQLLSDQLNEGLTSDLRSMENADEVLEGVAVLLGNLIGNVLGDNGLSTGSYTDIKPDTVSDSEVDIPDPYKGGGGVISTTTDIYVNIDDAMLDVSANSMILDFEPNSSTVMRMQDPTSRDTTVKATSIEVPSLTVICDDGSHPDFGDLGKVEFITNAVVSNPAFETLSSSNATNVGNIDNARVLGDVFIVNADATYAHITELNLELDANAPADDPYLNALFDGQNTTPSEGDSIDNLELNILNNVVSFENNAQDWGSTIAIRGGTTQTPSTMILNSVVLIGGTVEHGGETCKIVPYENRVCDYDENEGTSVPCTQHKVSGITGNDLQIVDSRDAWAIMNPNMQSILQNMTVEVAGEFEVHAGTISDVYD
jgi:hypothetical protein